ncbi:hypothetical protein GCM10018781_07970 [Kitasatospora indigofera]|uniref:Uncharacterized protein n=1 Tax=Kitasatospora indigofera TaxID=67307 RepID=A0A919KKI5_9ACTN|nr:hypothetical protein GCM10018781_07970 [Kitasatospora indigofera]
MRPRTDNEQTITIRGAYADSKRPKRHCRAPREGYPAVVRAVRYQEPQGRFQPLRPLSGSTWPRLEFCTVTTSPTSEES